MDWCKPFQIKPQTIVTWTKYATNCFSGNDFGVTIFHWIFLNAKQWIFDNGGHLSILHKPFSYTHSWTFNLWKFKTNARTLSSFLAFWPWGYVKLLFCGSKNFLTLQMRYPNSEGGPTGVFNDGVGHLQHVNRLAYLSWSQFILTRILFASSTIQVYFVKYILSKHLNIIIRSVNKKAFDTIPRLL
jgi:hypothetical protein